jgi:hypothetical protein
MTEVHVAPSNEVLQEQVNVIAWLHAEQRFEYMELVQRVINVGQAVAAILAQQAIPDVQEQLQNEILNRMMTGGVVTKLPDV